MVTYYVEGGGGNGSGGAQVKFYPCEKRVCVGGGGKVLDMVKEGQNKFWCSFYAEAFSHTKVCVCGGGGGVQNVSTL